MAAYSEQSAHPELSAANATMVRARAGRGWPNMTALGLADGSDQAEPGFRRARSRAWSRLSAMP